MRRDGGFFGERRLLKLLGRKCLSLERLSYSIIDQILAFSEGTLKDGMAILALLLREAEGYVRCAMVGDASCENS